MVLDLHRLTTGRKEKKYEYQNEHIFILATFLEMSSTILHYEKLFFLMRNILTNNFNSVISISCYSKPLLKDT